jgi:hypothetical protein
MENNNLYFLNSSTLIGFLFTQEERRASRVVYVLGAAARLQRRFQQANIGSTYGDGAHGMACEPKKFDTIKAAANYLPPAVFPSSRGGYCVFVAPHHPTSSFRSRPTIIPQKLPGRIGSFIVIKYTRM